MNCRIRPKFRDIPDNLRVRSFVSGATEERVIPVERHSQPVEQSDQSNDFLVMMLLANLMSAATLHNHFPRIRPRSSTAFQSRLFRTQVFYFPHCEN
jgi:hypothetical protein